LKENSRTVGKPEGVAAPCSVPKMKFFRPERYEPWPDKSKYQRSDAGAWGLSTAGLPSWMMGSLCACCASRRRMVGSLAAGTWASTGKASSATSRAITNRPMRINTSSPRA
jgi:hypothetical protein